MNYSVWQKSWLVVLRLVIGWHFLYEGLHKLSDPNWSSFGYLLDSQGFLKEFFYWMARNPDILGVVDFINIWGLIAIGLGMFLGLLTRPAIIAGIIMLSFYYLSHPPFPGLDYMIKQGGSSLLVNNILIELFALAVLCVFPTQFEFGIDKFICRKHAKKYKDN